MTNNKDRNKEICFGGCVCSDSIQRRFLNWDGTDIEAFANLFSNEELNEMDYWAYEYGCYQPSVEDEYPKLERDEEYNIVFTAEAKIFIIQCYIRCSLMMAIYAWCWIISGDMEQKELVEHYYTLLMKVKGVLEYERS